MRKRRRVTSEMVAANHLDPADATEMAFGFKGDTGVSTPERQAGYFNPPTDLMARRIAAHAKAEELTLPDHSDTFVAVRFRHSVQPASPSSTPETPSKA